MQDISIIMIKKPAIFHVIIRTKGTKIVIFTDTLILKHVKLSNKKK